MSRPYAYRYRPGYESTEMLIEFFQNDQDDFFTALFDALKPLQPIMPKAEKLWTVDAIYYAINTDMGRFTLSLEDWDFAFINAENNQSCITMIEKLLSISEDFIKEEVDFNNYKEVRK